MATTQNTAKREKRSFLQRIEEATVVRVIRSGLINIIPVLIIGAFALILNFFPVPAYQTFIQSFAGGILSQLFNLVNCATFGVLSLYMTFSISRSYMKIKADPEVVTGGAILASMVSFFILAGSDLAAFPADLFKKLDPSQFADGGIGFGPSDVFSAFLGPKSMFLAILAALGASAMYLALFRLFNRRRRKVFSSGADREFNRVLSTLAPITVVVLVFALINLAVDRFTGSASFRDLLARFFNWLFSFGKIGFFKGFFFVLLSSTLWFFGIHGSDTLEGVMSTYFTPGLEANQAAVAAGQAPTFILSKQFFDCFVLMGGCGSAICLLLAILIFSRNKARRGLGLTAAFPMIFNINELMVFGLPIVFNPIMLVPFLAVPLTCYSTAYLATAAGWVPVIANEVNWTTPIILGGYTATGSLAGAVMQVVNVAVGVLIYMPFVRLLDRQSELEARRNFASFMDYFKKNEASFANEKLTDRTDVNGEFAKGLCADLKHEVARRPLTLAYQPQYDYEGKCVGVEALLRWKHPAHGVLYPPLVFKLAEEGDFLAALEEKVVRQVLADRPKVQKRFGEGVKISFNITGTTVVTDRFLEFCRALNAKDSFRGKNLCLEVTEQAAIAFDEKTAAHLAEIRDMGILLAIDDFSMGQTSINYLKNNTFDILKLDGSLVRGLLEHNNCREIISSIVQLTSSLHLMILAEFVETEEQKEILHEIGCDCYQGYLYSPAVFLDEEK